jgi:methyl-accepting chemotaxis protein
MALRDVQAVVTITTNATKAIDDGKKLRETYKATLDIIKQFRTDGKIDTPEGKELLKLADDLQAKIKALVTGMDLIRGVADNLANKTGKDVNRAMREISKEFNKTANETDADKQKLKELSDTLAKLKALRDGK